MNEPNLYTDHPHDCKCLKCKPPMNQDINQIKPLRNDEAAYHRIDCECPLCTGTKVSFSEGCQHPDPVDEGGPAFPTLHATQVNKEITLVEGHKGMSLRDWFAGQALAGVRWGVVEGPNHAARFCYQVADAMLKARKP